MVSSRHMLIYMLGGLCCGIIVFYYNYIVNVSSEFFCLIELFTLGLGFLGVVAVGMIEHQPLTFWNESLYIYFVCPKVKPAVFGDSLVHCFKPGTFNSQYCQAIQR